MAKKSPKYYITLGALSRHHACWGQKRLFAATFLDGDMSARRKRVYVTKENWRAASRRGLDLHWLMFRGTTHEQRAKTGDAWEMYTRTRSQLWEILKRVKRIDDNGYAQS